MASLFRRQTRERERRDELLSAYLDGELGARERERLEAKLATDPALRAELEELRHTVSLVRDLPPVQIPRNFILAKAMAAQERPAPSARLGRVWAAPLLTAATAIVSLLFVVVLASDLLPGVGGLGFAPAALAPEEFRRAAPQASPMGEEVEPELVVMPTVTSAQVVPEAPPAATAEREAAAAVSTSVPLPSPRELPPQVGAGRAAEAEQPAAEMREGVEVTATTTCGCAASAEAATPASIAVTPVGEEDAAGAAFVAAPTPAIEKGVDGAEPTAGRVAEVPPLPVGEDESAAPEREWSLERRPRIAGAPVLLWRALELALGAATVGLAWVTIRAWRARRR